MATDTVTHLLDTAQRLVEERGFNAFSYRDLAAEVGIRTASIHYHFSAKADLGRALMARYQVGLDEALAQIDRKGRTARSRLKKFVGLYRETEQRGAICLCGSMASDIETLPGDLRPRVVAYLERSESWVERTIRDGIGAGEFTTALDPRATATALVSGLQGALILARAMGSGVDPLAGVETTVLATLENS